MEHYSSYNRQIRKEIMLKTILMKRIRRIEDTIQEKNTEGQGGIDREIERIEKVIRRRKQKNRKHQCFL